MPIIELKEELKEFTPIQLEFIRWLMRRVLAGIIMEKDLKKHCECTELNQNSAIPLMKSDIRTKSYMLDTMKDFYNNVRDTYGEEFIKFKERKKDV